MDEIEKSIKLIETTLSDLRKMNIKEPIVLENHMFDNFPDFCEKYPSIIKRLCREENQDNTYLFKMLTLLKDIEKGDKSMASVELNLGEELAEKFVYPHVKK